MKKISTQLKAVNYLSEEAMLNLLKDADNLHFLTLANMVASGNMAVCHEIFKMKELHPVVLKLLLSMVPEEMVSSVKKHVSYREIDPDVLFPGCNTMFIEVLSGERKSLVPSYGVDDPYWKTQFSLNVDEDKWCESLIMGGSVPHIMYLIENSKLNTRVISSLLNRFTSEDDRLEMIGASVDAENHFLAVPMEAPAILKFLDDQRLIFKLIKEHQHLSVENELLIVWFYANGFIDLEAFKIFFDVKEELPSLLKYRLRGMQLDD